MPLRAIKLASWVFCICGAVLRKLVAWILVCCRLKTGEGRPAINIINAKLQIHDLPLGR